MKTFTVYKRKNKKFGRFLIYAQIEREVSVDTLRLQWYIYMNPPIIDIKVGGFVEYYPW